jgi:hypothetical protein
MRTHSRPATELTASPGNEYVLDGNLMVHLGVRYEQEASNKDRLWKETWS